MLILQDNMFMKLLSKRSELVAEIKGSTLVIYQEYITVEDVVKIMLRVKKINIKKIQLEGVA